MSSGTAGCGTRLCWLSLSLNWWSCTLLLSLNTLLLSLNWYSCPLSFLFKSCVKSRPLLGLSLGSNGLCRNWSKLSSKVTPEGPPWGEGGSCYGDVVNHIQTLKLVVKFEISIYHTIFPRLGLARPLIYSFRSPHPWIVASPRWWRGGHYHLSECARTPYVSGLLR